MRIREKLAQAVAVTTVVAAGVAATGTAAFAADVPYHLGVSTKVGDCALTLTSAGTTMNQQTRKDIDLQTESPEFGCTLQVFPYSNSSAYIAYTATPLEPYYTGPGGESPIYYPIHRIRICQSGDPDDQVHYPGACSYYLWWNHTAH